MLNDKDYVWGKSLYYKGELYPPISLKRELYFLLYLQGGEILDLSEIHKKLVSIGVYEDNYMYVNFYSLLEEANYMLIGSSDEEEYDVKDNDDVFWT